MSGDFSQGKVWKVILSQTIPLTLAQFVQLLYNIVDRIYIGHLPNVGSMALTGIGLTFPVVTLIMAFSCLYGYGGTPLFSIARGSKQDGHAKQIMGNVVSLVFITGIILMIFGQIFCRPILYLFGASDNSVVYAEAYLRIYLLGTIFTMATVALNSFINAQGFPRIGMLTTIIGAVLNIILDPIFIFLFGMGVRGAALATVISQAASALWVLRFLTGPKAVLKLEKSDLPLNMDIVKKIVSLGTSGFVMQGTNSIVQIVCNSTLQMYGGDLYVGIMTVLNSVREILSLPVSGISSGAQPVLGYNFGARLYDRVKEAIRFTSYVGVGYTALAWAIVFIFPGPIMKIFTSDPEIIKYGIPSMHMYFFGFVFMAFQFTGQMCFQGLGYAKHAVFFSLFRKVLIVVPLTLLLPKIMGVNGVFMAEPISNAIGGLACFITMWFTVYRKLGKEEE